VSRLVIFVVVFTSSLRMFARRKAESHQPRPREARKLRQLI
jgi:hypothetical protein